MDKKTEWGGKPLVVKLAFGNIPYTIDFPCSSPADIPGEGAIINGLDFIPETERYLVIVGHINSVLEGTGEKFNIHEADFLRLMAEMKDKKGQGWSPDILTDEKSKETYRKLSTILFEESEWLVFQHYIRFEKDKTVHNLILELMTGEIPDMID